MGWVLAGGVVGVLASVPFGVALRARRPSVPLGLVALLASFVLATGAIAAVRIVAGAAVLPFGASVALALPLACLRVAWRGA